MNNQFPLAGVIPNLNHFVDSNYFQNFVMKEFASNWLILFYNLIKSNRSEKSKMLSKIVSSQRGFATTFKKVQVANPVVDMDGDEMTKVIWQWIKDKVSHLRLF